MDATDIVSGENFSYVEKFHKILRRNQPTRMCTSYCCSLNSQIFNNKKIILDFLVIRVGHTTRLQHPKGKVKQVQRAATKKSGPRSLLKGPLN